MRILLSIVLMVLVADTLFAQELSFEEQFETVFNEFEQDYRKWGHHYYSAYHMVCVFPVTPDFIKLGPKIVPLLVERIQSYEDKPRNLLRNSLAFIATALILDNRIQSEKVGDIIGKCRLYNKAQKQWDIIPDLWLKWWEVEGKALYEKRIKELEEKPKKPEEEPKKELSPEKQFEVVFNDFEQQYKKPPHGFSTAASMLDAFPQTLKFVKLGPKIIPLLVEKIQSYEDKPSKLLLVSLMRIAIGLIFDQHPSFSRQVDNIISKCSRPYRQIRELWLKWWEEEGKALYEKRIKEIEERTEKKSESESPKKEPEREKTEPETKPLSKPVEPEQKAEVNNLPSEKQTKQQVLEEGRDWFTLGLIITGIVIAIILIFYRFRRK